MKLLRIYIFIIVGLTSLSAFTFDKWESGTKLTEAIQVARINNIPLTIQSSVFMSKKFDWRYLKNHQNHRVLYYKQDLMGGYARVALYFTQESKKLYKIQISWTGLFNKQDFTESLYRVIDKKYGQRNIVMPSNVGEYVFYTKRMWRIDNNSIVQSNTSSGMVELVYLDKKYELDDLQTKQKKKLDMIITDANKF
ncbi:MAG: hypothetical protein COB07_10230 [Sulfurovum sp.]|nr:MAG: hypothetical protein COB07_10230 [Sulfurovum sp.]